ncbi:zinc ribbon domain-containing protein [candidate division KSB1 bacterium]|nr:zinc ribbon domain-containing protein [candidate division KSB1 bacterium]
MFDLSLKRLFTIVLAALAFTVTGRAQAPVPDLPYKHDALKPGEVCLVSGKSLTQGDVVYLIRGRRVPLRREQVRYFIADSTRYLAQLQPQSALFHEAMAQRGTEAGGIDLGWFLFGMYVLVALFFGGLSGYAAVSKGLNPIPHFFIGLFFSAPGYLYVLTRPRAATAGEVPSGFVKVHTTHEPVPCGRCGYTNHPAAKLCSGCGAKLQPIVASEVEKAK